MSIHEPAPPDAKEHHPPGGVLAYDKSTRGRLRLRHAILAGLIGVGFLSLARTFMLVSFSRKEVSLLHWQSPLCALAVFCSLISLLCSTLLAIRRQDRNWVALVLVAATVLTVLSIESLIEANWLTIMGGTAPIQMSD